MKVLAIGGLILGLWLVFGPAVEAKRIVILYAAAWIENYYSTLSCPTKQKINSFNALNIFPNRIWIQAKGLVKLFLFFLLTLELACQKAPAFWSGAMTC